MSRNVWFCMPAVYVYVGCCWLCYIYMSLIYGEYIVNVHSSDIPHTFIPHFTLHSAEKIRIKFSANYPLTTFRIPQNTPSPDFNYSCWQWKCDLTDRINTQHWQCQEILIGLRLTTRQTSGIGLTACNCPILAKLQLLLNENKLCLLSIKWKLQLITGSTQLNKNLWTQV